MDKAKLLEKLAEIGVPNSDREIVHREADVLLIEYINDPEIEAAYDEVEKWYA